MSLVAFCGALPFSIFQQAQILMRSAKWKFDL